MSENENLSKAQFPDDYPAGDGPLKSPWIPVITNSRLVKWHILSRHIRFERRSEPGAKTPIWAKTGGPDRGDMSHEEYHDYLHKIGHFDKDSEHKHFVPKKRM